MSGSALPTPERRALAEAVSRMSTRSVVRAPLHRGPAGDRDAAAGMREA